MQVFILILVLVASAATQVLIGGAGMSYLLPGLTLLSAAAVLSLILVRRPLWRPDPWATWSAIALFAYILVRSLNAPVAYLADEEFYGLASGFLLYLLFSLWLTGEKSRMAFVTVLCALGLAHLALSLHQYARDPDFTLFGIGRFHYGWRASGLYICPNHAATVFYIIVLLGLAQLLWGKSGRALAPLWLLAVLSGALGLFLTASRAGLLGLAAGLAVLVLISIVAWSRLTLRGPAIAIAAFVALAAAAAATTAIIANQADDQKVVARYLNGGNDLSWRLLAWEGAWRHAQIAPAFGTGPGTHGYYGRFLRDKKLQVDVQKAHNDYLEFLAEYGISGSVLLLLALVAHFRSGWRSLRSALADDLPRAVGQRSTPFALRLAAFAALAALAAHSLFDFTLQIPGNTFLAAFLLALLASPGPDPDPRARPLRPNLADTLARLLPAPLGLFLLLTATPRLPEEYYATLARNSFRKDDFLATIAHCNDALRHGRHNPFVLRQLGESRYRLAIRMGNPSASRLLLRRALPPLLEGRALYPQDSPLGVSLARSLDALGRFDESEEIWNQLVRDDPNSAFLQANHGLHLHASGNYPAALAAYQRALDLGLGPPALAPLIANATASLPPGASAPAAQPAAQPARDPTQ